jgi:hypothetical protein
MSTDAPHPGTAAASPDEASILEMLEGLEEAISAAPAPEPAPAPPPAPPAPAPFAASTIIPAAVRSRLGADVRVVTSAGAPTPAAAPVAFAAAPKPVDAIVGAASGVATATDPFAPARTVYRDPPPRPQGYTPIRGSTKNVLAAFPWEPKP